jgi:DUF1365 family protein
VSTSCIYVGTVRHRRYAPAHELRHRLALFLIDLDELPNLLDGRLVRSSPGPLRFRRSDYHGDPRTPLPQAVRDSVQAQTGVRPDGPIRLLTQLSSFGHCFNPVSFYYCLSDDGARTEAILAEVTNTPWNERHAYVLRPEQDDDRLLDASFDKAFHVSPFMSMDHTYRAPAGTPGETLSVHVESRRQDTLVFDATLSLARRELSGATARRIALRYPLASARVLALIYAHAVGLKLAGARLHPHPPRQAT